MGLAGAEVVDDVVLRSRARTGSVGMGEAGETREQADKRFKGLGISHLALWHCCCSSSLLALPTASPNLFLGCDRDAVVQVAA